MRFFHKIVIIAAFLFAISVYSAPIPYSQDDRDRLIRLEEKANNLEKRMDQMQTFMLWGFGILFGGMSMMIGFVLWDRRTALAPAVKKQQELEEREEKLEKALKLLAQKDKKIAASRGDFLCVKMSAQDYYNAIL